MVNAAPRAAPATDPPLLGAMVKNTYIGHRIGDRVSDRSFITLAIVQAQLVILTTPLTTFNVPFEKAQAIRCAVLRAFIFRRRFSM